MLLALVWSAAPAQDADARLRAMEAELEQLKKRVDVLEGRAPVPAPSAAVPAAATPPSAAALAPAGCPGASTLKMSMSQAEVRRVLGEPTNVESTPLRTVWRYPCGRAYFDADTRLFVCFVQAR